MSLIPEEAIFRVRSVLDKRLSDLGDLPSLVIFFKVADVLID